MKLTIKNNVKWLALVGMLISLNTWATPADDLAAKLSGYKSFDAEFTQYVSDKTGMTVQEAQGQIKAMRPGKFYWHTYPPIEQIIVSDGVKVTVFDPDLEQATIQPVSKDIASTPALLLSGDVKNIEKYYAVTFQKSDQAEEFILTPKSPDSLFESLKLRFEKGALYEMRMMDSLGQKSVIGFDKVTLNPKFTDKTFMLDLPKGTDVIEDKHQ